MIMNRNQTMIPRVLCLAALITVGGLPTDSLAKSGAGLHAVLGGGARVPAAWAGIWVFTKTEYACPTNDIVSTTVGQDTLCAGELFEEENDPFTCITSINDAGADVVCSAAFELIPGCTVVSEYETHLRRIGDSIVGTTTGTASSVPAGCAGPETCGHEEYSGVRIAPPPADCSLPVDDLSWGQLKSRYR